MAPGEDDHSAAKPRPRGGQLRHLTRASSKIHGHAKALREKQTAMNESGVVDAVFEPRREVPLRGNAQFAERDGWDS